MKTAQVVIGANYGDEGKGLMTDYLASQTEKPLVVRHNSSAQAGHTVVTPDGRRHIFHHVGSGAFTGASTFLSQFFVVHPMLLTEELNTLETLGVTPTLYVDPRATVAVPYDVLINQLLEEVRGGARHGSCGIGFGEAVERSLRPRFTIQVRDFKEPEWVFDRLRTIRDGWVPRRLKTLGLTIPEEHREILTNDAMLWRWMEDMAKFRARTVMTEAGELPPGSPIFEGAQGLLLDEDSTDFPHVTRSKTGLANVVRTAQEVGIEHLDVTYVTRTYLTRHGAGPLANSLPEPPEDVEDLTNQPNAFQGDLRFAWLDLDSLAERIREDLNIRAQGIKVTSKVAITCLDQLENVTYLVGGKTRIGNSGQLIQDIERAVGLPVNLTSEGPARTDVRQHTTKEALSA